MAVDNDFFNKLFERLEGQMANMPPQLQSLLQDLMQKAQAGTQKTATSEVTQKQSQAEEPKPSAASSALDTLKGHSESAQVDKLKKGFEENKGHIASEQHQSVHESAHKTTPTPRGPK